MRTVANVVGVGQRKQGVSKNSGKPYDFQSVSFTYSDPKIIGEAAATALLSGPELDAIGGVKPGDCLDIFCREFGGKVMVDGIVGKV